MEAFLAQHSLSASIYTSSLCELIIPGGLILPDKREKGKKALIIFVTVTETKHSAVLTLVWLFRACTLASSSAIQFAVRPQGTGKIFVLKSMAKLLLTLLIGWSSSSGSVLQLRGGSVRLLSQPLRGCYPSLALSWCFFDSAGGSIDHSPTGFPSEPAQISGADEIGPTEPQPLQRRRRTQLFLFIRCIWMLNFWEYR